LNHQWGGEINKRYFCLKKSRGTQDLVRKINFIFFIGINIICFYNYLIIFVNCRIFTTSIMAFYYIQDTLENL